MTAIFSAPRRLASAFLALFLLALLAQPVSAVGLKGFLHQFYPQATASKAGGGVVSPPPYVKLTASPSGSFRS